MTGDTRCGDADPTRALLGDGDAPDVGSPFASANHATAFGEEVARSAQKLAEFEEQFDTGIDYL